MCIQQFFPLILIQLFLSTFCVAQLAVGTLDPASCTRYTKVDLYLILNFGVSVSLDTVKLGFKFIDSLVGTIDLNKTRVAFSMGDKCCYAREINGLVFYHRADSYCLTGHDDNFRFNFRRHESLKANQKFASINATLNRIQSYAIGSGSSSSESSSDLNNRADPFSTSVAWLTDLINITRQDAELAVIVLTMTQEQNQEVWRNTKVLLDERVPWITTQLCSRPEKSVCPLGHLPPEQVITLSPHLQTLSQTPQILRTLCSRLQNCHYSVYNEQDQHAAVCRWDDAGVCKKNLSNLIVIVKNALHSGRNCPTTEFESCLEKACQTSCDTTDSSPWSQWSVCTSNVTCGARRKQLRSRRVNDGRSIKCKTEDVRSCQRCLGQNVTVKDTTDEEEEPTGGANWYYIATLGLLVIAMTVMVGGSYLLWRRRSRSSPSKHQKYSSSKDKSRHIKKRRSVGRRSKAQFAAEKLQHLSLPTYSKRQSDKMKDIDKKSSHRVSMIPIDKQQSSSVLPPFDKSAMMGMIIKGKLTMPSSSATSVETDVAEV